MEHINDSLNVNHRQSGWIKKCINLALRSNLTHKHGCIVVKDDMIVSSGFNYRSCDKSYYNGSTRVNGRTRVNNNHNNNIGKPQKCVYSTHAEMAAIKGAKKKNLCDSDMYIVRIGPQCCNHHFSKRPPFTNTDEFDDPSICYLKYSHPCETCSKLIQKSGIRRVYYSTNWN